MNPSLKIFQPSGLNDQFQGHKDLPFADYIAKTRQMMAQARVDIASDAAEKILNANAPYQWLTPSSPRQGVLLVHGLYDSPFTLRDIGDYFAKQGLLVRSVLLPGHGTVPGDLLNVQYPEWLKAVDYGVETLAKEVEQIFIVGYSLGGVLTLHKALTDARISGIVLISPALSLKAQWVVGQLIRLQKLFCWAMADGQWYKKRPFQHDYTKYESFACNAGTQIYKLVVETRLLLHKNNLSIPLFLTISAEDEVVSAKACLDFFTAHTHPNSRLLWYAHNPLAVSDNRVIVKNDVFPAQKILDFSHICLPIAPENLHYGVQGDYQDFLAYPDNKPPLQQPIFLGATSKTNLRAHTVQRLSYNPDFKGMLELMGNYLKQCAV